LVEGQDLFLLSLKFPTQLGCLEDTLTKRLVLSQLIHALQTVGDKKSEVIFFLATQFSHLLLQVVVVSDDGVFFPFESIVTISVFSEILLGLQSETKSLSFDTVDVMGVLRNLLGGVLIVVEELTVLEGLGLGLVHVLLETDLEGIVKGIDLLDQVHLHGLLLLDVLVTDLLLLGEEGLGHCLRLGVLLFIDRVDHLSEL